MVTTDHQGKPLIDLAETWPTLDYRVEARGAVSAFVEAVVDTPPFNGVDCSMVRQWITHPGSVSVMALDDQGRVAVVHQYRHPVGMRLVEPPAGLLDVSGESSLLGAQRELAEEAQLEAEDWRILVDEFTSPGGSEEHLRIFLARGLHEVGQLDGFVAEHEEADMGLYWVPLDELVDGVRAGTLQSPTIVAGTLALALAVATDSFDLLRPADAPWPARELKADRDRQFG